MAKKDKTYDNKARTPSIRDYICMFVAELVATALLMFLGCMGCILGVDDPPTTHHFGGIAFGLTVLTIIQIFGNVSGAHLNPAVTIATCLCGILTPIMGAVYIVAQFIGAILGYGLLKLVTPDYFIPAGFCATVLRKDVTPIQGLVIEIVITSVLVFVCLAVWDKRNAHNTDSVPIKFGGVISVISFVAGPFTGASMNTARSLAPMVFGGTWDNHWIYWVGPNLAPFLACAMYKFLFSGPREHEDDKIAKETISLNEVS